MTHPTGNGFGTGGIILVVGGVDGVCVWVVICGWCWCWCWCCWGKSWSMFLRLDVCVIIIILEIYILYSLSTMKMCVCYGCVVVVVVVGFMCSFLLACCPLHLEKILHPFLHRTAIGQPLD